jgi:sorting nexin-8
MYPRSKRIHLIPATDLPLPRLPSLSSKPQVPSSVQEVAQSGQEARYMSQNEPVKPQGMSKDPTIDQEADPWGNPAMHKNHNHDALRKTNGTLRTEINGFRESGQTTNTFASLAEGSSSGINKANPDANTQSDGVWGSYGAIGSSSGLSNPIGSGMGAGGFDGNSGGGDQGRPAPFPHTRAIGGGQVNRGVEETIQIQLLPEKEGMFLFQHHNYHVISVRRGSKVVRRYSDFVWLLDCLHKRFPFRQLPLLPPKRVGGM